MENRLNLASLLYDHGDKEEADEVASDCATGVFKEDPEVISEVAWYKVAIEKYAEAEQLLLKADTKRNKIAKHRIDLLHARILLGNQRYEEAKHAFTALQSAGLGEEPRYYAALCHLGLGETQEGMAILTDITKSFRKGNRIWRRAEKTWFEAARRKLKEVQAGTNSDSKAPQNRSS